MAQEPQGAKLTVLGTLVSLLLIAALIGGGAYLIVQKYGSQLGLGTSSNQPSPGSTTPDPDAPKPEAPDAATVTTVKEYKYVPADRLPAVKGVSQYEWDEKNKIFRFSYNVWAGWLPIVAANHGTKPNEDSVFFKKHGFKVDMVLMDDPVAARDAFAAGKVHSLWGTVDMMTLFAPELARDSRTAPRIVQQIDWSSGGDGIVVRNNIRNVADLKGRAIALAQNSPSEYYLVSLLLSAGMRPADIRAKYTATAFEAAAAFVSDKSVDACVSWAPDIYNISDRIPGTRILSSTADANKLIADVYAVRADFVRDHPEIVEGLISSIFEGMDLIKQDPQQACQWMADAFGMKADEVMAMRQDFHATNFAENVQFFLNASNPTNFERTWKNAAYVYRTLGRIDSPVPFDQVMDFSFIQKLDQSKLFAHQVDESRPAFTPAAFRGEPAEAPILTQTIRINFFPNSHNPYEPARDQYNMPIPGKLYDPNVDATLEEVARLAGQFERSVILIEGHTDASMRGRIPVSAVKELSQARANAIKAALLDKFKFDPNKFTVKGSGWDRPADADHPDNHALNRRVEISVFPPESN